MKLKTLIAGIAMALGVTFLAQAAWAQNSASANASATVVDPIALSATADLNFGSFEPGASGGTVIVDQAGAASETGTVVRVPSGNPTSAAAFDVTGQDGAGYDILATSGGLLGPGPTMALAPDAPANGTLAGGADSFNVGGTLTVAAGQTPGDYSGTVEVTVTYQ